jgi:hypothetical protein
MHSKPILALMLMILSLPAVSKSQQLSTDYSQCNSSPTRRDNEHTRSPYDDIVYYNCVHVREMYRNDQSNIQSRETCQYTKMVYYDRYWKKWATRNHISGCSTKTYPKKEEKTTILPVGWHPPLNLK